MTSIDHYDFIVIGGGPAGQGAAEVAAIYGRRTLVIERNVLGGVVVTTGGAPTKTLRDAALYLTGFRDRDVYGLVGQIDPSLAGMRLRSRTAEVCSSMQECVRATFEKRGIDVIYGTARLDTGLTVFVMDKNHPDQVRKFSADHILLATGSRPFRPPNISFKETNVFDSENLFTIPKLPKSIVVIGGGAIGCEYASIFSALGVSVILVHGGERLLPMMDSEISGLAAKVFEKMGIHSILNTRVTSSKRVEDGLEIRLENGESLRSEAVLVAVGRLVNTEGLGLKEVGVETNEHGEIIVDHNFQTSVKGIYAAGDVISPSLSSVSMEQGRVAACHAFDLTFKQTMDPLLVWAVYSVPEVAGVGLTEEDAKTQGIDYEVGRSSFAMLPRGIISGHPEGMLKLVFRRDTRRLLGVHVLGDIASELIGLGQATIHCHGKIDLFNQLTFATPTYTMAYKFAAFDGL
ncbi:MAG: FAD-dependent oxidoreductase, partial [Gammaproteobacteria bacterium]